MGILNLTGKHGATQGQDHVFNLIFFTDSTKTTKVNLSTLTAAIFAVKTKATSDTELVRLTLGSGIEVLGPTTNGTLQVIVPFGDTAGLDPVIYMYDVQTVGASVALRRDTPFMGEYEIHARIGAAA